MTDHTAHTGTTKRMAASATLHCLIGCAIGEMVGVTIGTPGGFAVHQTIMLASALSFGERLHLLHVATGARWHAVWQSLKLVFVADTLSILTMTVADNIIMATVPGAMDKDTADILDQSCARYHRSVYGRVPGQLLATQKEPESRTHA